MRFLPHAWADAAAGSLPGRSTGGGPPADELQSGYLPTFDPFSVRRIYHTPGAFRTAEAERALERKGWLEKESGT